MHPINCLVIDSSKSTTDLCTLGKDFGTDKSPYSTSWHHHPYTAVYDLLFSGLRDKDILFGELGILDNSSMKMWRAYFPKAKLFGYEFFEDRLEAARQHELENTEYWKADVSDAESLKAAFSKAGRKFDVLIDDSTHYFEHQINFVKVAVNFTTAGGLIIVEDIFRGWDESRYSEALSCLAHLFSSMTFIDTSHEKAYSGGNTIEPYFDNDKLLVLRMKSDSENMPANSGRAKPYIATGSRHTDELSAFMVTHKHSPCPDDPFYLPIYVGSRPYSEMPVTTLQDSTADNISGKNDVYSELTAIYWIWKNYSCKYLAISHYRRFFAAKNDGIAFGGQKIASGQDLLDQISSADIIAVRPLDLFHPNTSVPCSVEQQYVGAHGFEIAFARRAVEELAAEYLPIFDFVMRNNKLIAFNMLIARKEIFNEYCAWLFPLLLKIETLVVFSEVSGYQARVIAFLSERLFTVWLVHAKRKYDIKFQPYVFYDNL